MKLLIKALIWIGFIIVYSHLMGLLFLLGYEPGKIVKDIILIAIYILVLWLCKRVDFWYFKYRAKKLMKEMPQLEGETKEDYKTRLMQELKRQGVMPEKKKKE